jgi:hypothetical protein
MAAWRLNRHFQLPSKSSMIFKLFEAVLQRKFARNHLVCRRILELCAPLSTEPVVLFHRRAPWRTHAIVLSLDEKSQIQALDRASNRDCR